MSDIRLARVSGRGEFPIDMLRYDSCSPATELDSGLISDTFNKYGYWEIYVKTGPLPKSRKVCWTPDRWKSFGVRFEPLDTCYPPHNRMTEIDTRPAKERVGV